MFIHRKVIERQKRRGDSTNVEDMTKTPTEQQRTTTQPPSKLTKAHQRAHKSSSPKPDSDTSFNFRQHLGISKLTKRRIANHNTSKPNKTMEAGNELRHGHNVNVNGNPDTDDNANDEHQQKFAVLTMKFFDEKSGGDGYGHAKHSVDVALAGCLWFGQSVEADDEEHC
mmetsp:Transcript_33181/g.37674  ORF Transcript_33181/g.37674 Transcript_33181/m.37674 type:complete len:169 (+) Transcript_33181:1261-1767(+)